MLVLLAESVGSKSELKPLSQRKPFLVRYEILIRNTELEKVTFTNAC